MQLEGLRSLHASMRVNNVTRTQFQYRHNNIFFDVLFFTDRTPYKLLFGAIGHKCSFILDVRQGYDVAPVIKPESAYSDLCKALGLTYDPANPFRPSKFLGHFAQHIPSSVESTKEPSASVNQHAEIVDDGEKVFFSHWRNNGSTSHVSEKNLDKTYRAFGRLISDFCLDRNISSCWTIHDKKN